MSLDEVYRETLKQTSLKSLQRKKFLLAISGGVDSAFLYDTYRRLSYKYNFDIGVAHVNYNSNKNSENAMNLCKEFSKKYKHVLYLKNLKREISKNFESQAREVRYSMFKKIKHLEGYDYIVTGHHRDDLLETLYMQDKNKEDFSIIPFSDSRRGIIRPLLNIEKINIKKYANKHSLKYVEDLSNLDLKFRRNNVRLNLIPNEKNITHTKKSLIDIYNSKKQKLDMFLIKLEKHKKDILFNENLNQIKIKASMFESMNMYMVKIIIQGALSKYMNIDFSKTQKFWSNLFHKISKNKKPFFENFEGGLKLFCNFKYIYLFKEDVFVEAKKMNHGSIWFNGIFKVLKEPSKVADLNSKNVFICPEKTYKKGLVIRKWIPGDKFELPRGGRKKVSDLFNENKLDTVIKKKQPIILSNDRIEWIPGLAFSKNNYQSNDKTFSIEWIQNEKT